MKLPCSEVLKNNPRKLEKNKHENEIVRQGLEEGNLGLSANTSWKQKPVNYDSARPRASNKCSSVGVKTRVSVMAAGVFYELRGRTRRARSYAINYCANG